MKGSVASGHPLTSRAAIEMFSLGGNAFDAVVSAGFASVVTESALTSLGGGGFLLAHAEKEQKDILFDFFVNTPGLKNKEIKKPVMEPVGIEFPSCTQIFHTGFGSVAVPGMLKGLLHVHERLGTLPLRTVLAPSLAYLDEGVEISETQATFMGYLKPIFLMTEYGREICMNDGRYFTPGDRTFNPHLKGFYQGIADGCRDIYSGETAERLIEEMSKHNGSVTLKDLEAYQVVEREPLCITYRDREILTNPPPSFGGAKLALALQLLGEIKQADFQRDTEKFLIILIELIRKTASFKLPVSGEEVVYPIPAAMMSGLTTAFRKDLSERTVISTQGTTHISVIDEQGNAASMTTSNGTAAGCFIPGTGIMLNNMMGEDDLHPDGFHASPPNIRVSSMMLPTMVKKNGKVEYILGSGGSKRIRTAILQTLINIIDFNYPLREAVEAPRVHFEDGLAHFEPGIPKDLTDRLVKQYTVNRWDTKNMYFGGVHCVKSNREGWGDSRRGGSFMTSS